MRRVLGCLLLFSLPAALQAQSGVEIRIDPPAPTSRTPITATISGLWGDGCPPQAPAVSVAGGTIRISFLVSAHPCPIVHVQPEPWKQTTVFGPLAAGVYEVEAVVTNTPFGVIGRTRLVVREAEPEIRVIPEVIQTTGVRVRVEAPAISGCPPNVSPCPNAIVEFNGVRATEVNIVDNALLVTVPELPSSGPVEVVVRAYVLSDQVVFRTPNALFIARDPFTFDRALFERRLVPVLYRGPGAFGSEWITDVWIENASSSSVTLHRSPFEFQPCHAPLPCPRPIAPRAAERVHDQTRAGGLYLFPPRQSSNAIRANALVRDVSRQSEALGTELPIAGEEDFREQVQLLNVPSGRLFRVALRIYAHPASFPLHVPVKIWTMGRGILLHDGAVELRSNEEPSTASGPMNFTYTDILTQLDIPVTGPLRIEVGSPDLIRPIWAFASITNNTTQHVTIISPQ